MKTITTCSGTVDYSQMTGERILPFMFVLNEADSILHPTEGQYQKFCYDVTGIGQDTSKYADLSHFLLGSNYSEPSPYIRTRRPCGLALFPEFQSSESV